jgi:hypothetical protein
MFLLNAFNMTRTSTIILTITQRDALHGYLQLQKYAHPLHTSWTPARYRMYYLVHSDSVVRSRVLERRQSERIRHLEEDVNGGEHAPERLGARAVRVDRNIGERVHALGSVRREVALDGEAVGGIDRVRDVAIACRRRLGGRETRAVVAGGIVFAVVRVRDESGSESEARVPLGREVGALGTEDDRVVLRGSVRSSGVAGKTAVLVGTDGPALLAVTRSLGEVLGIDTTAEESVSNEGCEVEVTYTY